ncbi:GGDEF domain-containing protein [Shewanella sp. WXL01]|uniref:tetratricopeptide repeat-containing diguanylate cyclase n=1 Tax=Shewanella sp. WXL01 TaxID=2709721 RepID=UPI0014384FB9|nr:tetratricopeptide repeat-containing diguanylate cyclase [Shewanella sp. WXL01]NKF49220.1 GGDEF domain-containing protein [Shewanella sp. WXL01]
MLRETPQGMQLVKLFYRMEQEPDFVLERMQQLRNQWQFEQNLLFMALYHRTLHDIYVIKSDLEQAQQCADKMLALGNKHNERWIIAEAMTLNAILLARSGQGEAAFDKINIAIPLAEELHYHRLLSRALNARGVLYSRRLNYEESITDYQRAISYIEPGKNLAYLSKLYSNISVIYSRIKEWQEAIKYNERAIGIYLQGEHITNEHLVVLYTNGSQLYLEVDDLTKALNYSEKSVAVARKADSASLLTHGLWAQASILLRQERYGEARPLIEQCLELSEDFYDPTYYNRCLLEISKIEFAFAEYDSAITNATTALKVFEQVKTTELVLETHQLLSEVYQAAEQYPLAIVHLKHFYEGTQQVLFENREARMLELQEQFENELKEEQIALLTAENSLKQADLERKQLNEKFWILVTVIISMAVAWLLQRYRSNTRHISKLSSTNKDLFHQSNQDALTGLYNRRYIEDWVATRLPDSKAPFYSVVILDADFFKRVNDTYGHAAGDIVLKTMANRLSAHFRDKDILARWGGEEFILLLALESKSLPKDILNRINKVIADTPIEAEGVSLDMTISIGATEPVSREQCLRDWHKLKVAADEALYQAKEQGRNCAVVAEIAA